MSTWELTERETPVAVGLTAGPCSYTQHMAQHLGEIKVQKVDSSPLSASPLNLLSFLSDNGNTTRGFWQTTTKGPQEPCAFI